jgi:hypothetical protein
MPYAFSQNEHPFGQCGHLRQVEPFEKPWFVIVVWSLFGNVKIEHEWTLYTHIIYISFCVLVLKVVIYSEPSLVIVLKESNYMSICQKSSLSHDHHGLKYMNTLMNL